MKLAEAVPAVHVAPVPSVRERPILFKGEMVKAILAGRKTQTRRVVTPAPVKFNDALSPGDWWPRGDLMTNLAHPKAWTRCPHGVPGDRLWVRETFAIEEQLGTGVQRVVWRANERENYHPGFDGLWKPSIFMPRAACRLMLEVTDVRVQRVQDISEADAKAEGSLLTSGSYSNRGWFRELWQSINGTRGFGWDENPWVWCISFKPAVQS